MSEDEAFERRLSAVERAIADGGGDVATLEDAGDRERRLRAVEGRIETIEETVTELEAATQALRGYVGNVRSVNEDVEQRADAALAAVERLESHLGPTGQEGGDPDRVRAGDRQTPGQRRASQRSSARGVTSGTGTQSTGSDASSTLDGLDAGAEMPVPGADSGRRSTDTDERDVADDGVLDRVRDAL